MKREPILYVDDEESNLVVFKNTFFADYEILTANTGEEALSILETQEIPLVVTDQRMPKMTGVELLAQVREKHPDMIRMILTAYTDVEDIIDAINRGFAYKFITKPWDRNDLKITIDRALEAYHLALENKRLIEDLIQAEKLATVGQLASAISHEIKNQLAALSFADLIRSKYPDDERLLKYVDQITNARDRLLGIVNQIRDFAKGKAHRMAIMREDVGKLIDEVAAFLHLDPDVKHRKLEVDLAEDLFAELDADRIRQVLVNLIKNAAQATEKGNGVVQVSSCADDGKWACIRIKDNGCGIPPENLETIWEAFFTTKEDVGTGLGLHVCKQIIEAHKGQIECQSTVGEGTTFAVRLPLSAGAAESQERPEAVEMAESGS